MCRALRVGVDNHPFIFPGPVLVQDVVDGLSSVEVRRRLAMRLLILRATRVPAASKGVWRVRGSRRRAGVVGAALQIEALESEMALFRSDSFRAADLA